MEKRSTTGRRKKRRKWTKKKRKTRFWSSVEVDEETGCWNWTGTMRGGYGRAWNGEKMVTATHLALYYHNGTKVPDGKYVCHRCNNKRCVNPYHLYIGSAFDNRMDHLKKVYAERKNKL